MADEKKIEALEALFPQISGSAFTNAHDQALLAGVSVLLASDGAVSQWNLLVFMGSDASGDGGGLRSVVSSRARLQAYQIRRRDVNRLIQQPLKGQVKTDFLYG